MISSLVFMSSLTAILTFSIITSFICLASVPVRAGEICFIDSVITFSMKFSMRSSVLAAGGLAVSPCLSQVVSGNTTCLAANRSASDNPAD